MNKQNKSIIAAEIRRLSEKESQNKVAKRAGVSSATISQILNGNWELIKDSMWRKIRNALRIETTWQTAQTKNLETIFTLLNSFQTLSMSAAIVHDAGAGKSHSYKAYASRKNNVVYIECKHYWSKKSYARNLCRQAGLNDAGTTEELLESFIDYMKKLKRPLVIIDQTDKLKDSQMDLFMDFYNELESQCAFLLSGVPALDKRIRRGVQLDKIGYRELWSRIGRKFINLDTISHRDVSMICEANGLNDTEEIKRIYRTCEGDLRRVRRDVERYFLIQDHTEAA